MPPVVLPIKTRRLILRQWAEPDRPAFHRLNADSRVMRFFDFVRDREESDRLMDRLAAGIDEEGFGFFALQHAETGELIGFTGLNRVGFAAAFAPAVEIGWRLLPEYWGNGYATEAARACLALGFDTLGLARIVSFAVVENDRSRRVMERIGMRHLPEMDFDHPNAGRFKRHAFYQIAAGDYETGTSGRPAEI